MAPLISRLRAIVDEARSAGDMPADVARTIDEVVDQIEQRAARDLPVGNKAANLHREIDRWVRVDRITAGRGAELIAALHPIEALP
jgi:hypothetical protein